MRGHRRRRSGSCRDSVEAALVPTEEKLSARIFFSPLRSPFILHMLAATMVILAIIILVYTSFNAIVFSFRKNLETCMLLLSSWKNDFACFVVAK